MILTRINLRQYIYKMMPQVVFVLGAPGAGKGTQCKKIVDEFGFIHLSAGDLLREERAKEGSQYGELIENYIKEGKIVPVDITCSLLEHAMNAAPTKNFLIDGFPRNQDNLDGWNRRLSNKVKLLLVLFFDCSLEICTDRCLARGAAGSGRSDDNVESLKKRFDTYLNETKPVIDHYDKDKLVACIDGNQAPDAVFEEVKKVFNGIGVKEVVAASN